MHNACWRNSTAGPRRQRIQANPVPAFLGAKLAADRVTVLELRPPRELHHFPAASRHCCSSNGIVRSCTRRASNCSIADSRLSQSRPPLTTNCWTARVRSVLSDHYPQGSLNCLVDLNRKAAQWRAGLFSTLISPLPTYWSRMHHASNVFSSDVRKCSVFAMSLKSLMSPVGFHPEHRFHDSVTKNLIIVSCYMVERFYRTACGMKAFPPLSAFPSLSEGAWCRHPVRTDSRPAVGATSLRRKLCRYQTYYFRDRQNIINVSDTTFRKTLISKKMIYSQVECLQIAKNPRYS